MNRVNPLPAEPQVHPYLEGAEKILQTYGLDWKLLDLQPTHGRNQPDAIVEIGKGEQKQRFVVEVKQRPRTAQAGAIAAKLRNQPQHPLLVADYVNPELAEKLRHNEVCFVDLEGNAYLHGAGMLIWVTGRKDTRRIQIERDTRRAFQPTGLKVVFALLCRPELVEDDYRTLAQITGAALGTVQWVMRDLIQEGYVLRKGRAARRLVQLDRLLDDWALGYARDLRPKLLLGRYEIRDFARWREIDLTEHRAAWGGEAAAALLTGYLKPETLTIWVERLDPRLLVTLGLRPEEKGRVQIRETFWTKELAAGEGGAYRAIDGPKEAERTAPPILVYAELLAIGDARTLETARWIREERIREPFERYRTRAIR